VAAAVDLCEATILAAASHRADLLLVHHGLFWGGARPIAGPTYRRIAALVRHNLAVYSAHLPLDRHPEVGNSPLLAKALGIAPCGEFGEARGVMVGVWGEVAIEREVLQARITSTLGAAPQVLPFGPSTVRRVGVITGAGGSMIADARAAGLDTYITGEGSHHTYFDAEELGLNVFYGGHYATETMGVKALARHLEVKFGLPWSFLDHPTGL
jgi:dinuclear metal center YbgI/SA1388 family protein